MQNEGQSGGWTDFNQSKDPDCCQGGTNATAVKDLVADCADIGFGANPQDVGAGNMATSGGEIQSAYNKMLACWNTPDPERPWTIRLPVVTCPSNNVGTCEKVVGFVKLEIVWISGTGEDPEYLNVPYNEHILPVQRLQV